MQMGESCLPVKRVGWLVLGDLWPRVASWLLKFLIVSQTQAGTSAPSVWFDSASWLLISAIRQPGSFVSSFVAQGKGLVLVFGDLWRGVAAWLLKFRIAELDTFQTQAGTSANLGWFDSAKGLLQSAVWKPGGVSFVSQGKGLMLIVRVSLEIKVAKILVWMISKAMY